MENLKNANASVETINVSNEDALKILNSKEFKSKKRNKAQKKVVETAKRELLTKVNLSKFADRINKFGVTENSVSKQKSLLYNYPENWTSLQINGQEGKNFRSSLRKKLLNFANEISINEKIQNIEKLKDAIKRFNEFYKITFKVNDYSIASISHTKGEITEYYSLMLDIIKSYQSEKKSKK